MVGTGDTANAFFHDGDERTRPRLASVIFRFSVLKQRGLPMV